MTDLPEIDPKVVDESVGAIYTVMRRLEDLYDKVTEVQKKHNEELDALQKEILEINHAIEHEVLGEGRLSLEGQTTEARKDWAELHA